MKFAVTFVDLNIQATLPPEELELPCVVLQGTKELPMDDDETMFPSASFMEDIQNLVDKIENEPNGAAIDQGGDEDWYELDLPDGSTVPEAQAILDRFEALLP